MAEHRTRICDWKEDKPDSLVCGKEAPYDVTAQIGKVILTGDFCKQHGDETIYRLRTIGGLVNGRVKVDSKPRNAYPTKQGEIVTSKDIREWAIAQGRVKSRHGRLSQDLIQEYLDTH